MTPLPRALRLPSLATLMIAAAMATASASGPVSWTTATQADFLKGQASGVSIDEAGRLTAAPAVTELHDAAAPQVWALAATADGWVAGTGADGRVLRSQLGRVTTLLDTPETNIYAVATAPDGRVFAASGPDGKVYVIDAAGVSKVLFDPAEKYVWALLVDRAGRLWVGAGSPAVIYRVETDGTSKTIYRPTANHVVSLAIDSTGRVLAGTEGPGRIYRFDLTDRPTALFDAGLAELRAIATAADGTVFAAGLMSDSTTPDGTATSASLGASASSSAPAASAPARKSVLYRLPANGLPEPLWETTDVIYDVVAGDAGAAIVATGPDGHIYSVRPNGSEVLMNGVDARQVTRILKNGAAFLVATANPGRVEQLGPATANPGTFLSAPRDAKVPARWGSIRWEATGAVTIATRSGNTERPDDSWSDWSAAYATAAGSAITSPSGRYVQWKATFTGPASLTSVTVGYLPANARPVVTSITVHPAGTVFQKPFADDGAIAGFDDASAQQRRVAQGEPIAAAPALGRRMFQKSLQTFQWRAEDSDGDRLVYTLAYRREGDANWHEWKTGWLDTLAVWDTTTVPDGRYVMKVSASDASSNTPDRALIGERESAPFDIDNTPPAIVIDATRRAPNRITFTVRDAQTAIDHVEYALGGHAFVVLLPLDGVADSREERYELVLPAGADATQVMLRATDVMQNVSVVNVK